jgi:hypothetical protein
MTCFCGCWPLTDWWRPLWFPGRGDLLSSDPSWPGTAVLGQLRRQEREDVVMLIVGGLDIHRKQITYEYVDQVSGELRCGQIGHADRVRPPNVAAQGVSTAGTTSRSRSKRARVGGMWPRSSGPDETVHYASRSRTNLACRPGRRSGVMAESGLCESAAMSGGRRAKAPLDGSGSSSSRWRPRAQA